MPLKIKTYDFSLVIIPLIFIGVSVAVIYSLVFATASEGLGLKQGMIALIGLAIMFVVSFLDYRSYKGFAWIFYVVSILLLILVELFGKTVNGATNWIDLGFFQLQPSEVTKVSLIISLAAFFADKIGKLRVLDILLAGLMLIPPLILIAMEPDFGTALVIMFIFFIMVLISKPSKKLVYGIFSILLLGLSVFILAYTNVKPFSGLLKDYQKKRIEVFLNPSLDPYGRGYNVKQAQITIGSGGIMGNGLGKGSQSQLKFLPEPHTDFIFAGISESFGYLGSFTLLVLYCLFIIRIFDIGILARDNFGMMVAWGIGSMFFFQVVVNVGMNLGLMPVTGIPLPFLSSGGTSLLISLFSVGILQSIFIRHKKLSFNN